MNKPEVPLSSRREFLKTSSSAALAGAILAPQILRGQAQAVSPGETLKVGLIGCGGRGTGAAAQALKADANVALVALGDVFERPLHSSIKAIEAETGPEKIKVKPENMFAGLDAYKKVLASGIDVVLLATPPGFRPVHLRAAVEAGKHIFCEKPMATDAPGVRSVMESVRLAKERSLALVAGFCWRYDYPLRELFKRIHDGEIGEVRAIYGTYLTGPVKPMPPANTRKEDVTDVEWMIQNWYNFNWLGGDGFVEQAVHTCDWLAWAMKDVPPVSCSAVGGRQIPANGGNIYDHIEANFLWADGTRGFLAQRQIPGCHSENQLTVVGSKGTAQIDSRGPSIIGAKPWRYQGEKPGMYQVEHNELFASIRAGKPINDGDRMAKSTLLGILGRNAAYTGQQLTWEMILNSQQVLAPDITSMDMKFEPEPMAMPGRTKFI
ncbi:MAG TPA: Gfo/Idh/MocA family oxidoreductase [Verrucomicrobiae bacterium]|nr:Gfo/Idh/MocA family oxidoreductase [Verrucomicrobiae bacterium]